MLLLADQLCGFDKQTGLFLGLMFGLLACSGAKPEITTTASSTAYFSLEAPPKFPVEGFRVVALNTEFLFDGEGGEGEATFSHKGDPEKARVHRDRIGTIVRMLDADVLMLAEVENEGVLELLIEESLPGLGYNAFLVQGRDRFTGQNMGMLSRVAIDTVGRTDARVPLGMSERLQGVSKNLFARFQMGSQPVTIIGLHFLSQPSNPTRKPRREGQAEVIRQLVEQEMSQGQAVIVLGDFNDFDDRTPDRAASRPITDVLARIKRAGPEPDDDLFNVLADVAQADRFTAHYDRNRNDRVEPGELSAIDHILLSPQLYRRVRHIDFVHAHDPTVYTDHFPIVVTLAVD